MIRMSAKLESLELNEPRLLSSDTLQTSHHHLPSTGRRAAASIHNELVATSATKGVALAPKSGLSTITNANMLLQAPERPPPHLVVKTVLKDDEIREVLQRARAMQLDRVTASLDQQFA
mmetsp:Transcript_75315/g.200278  ORF Transcript_75315/g.200278 Transcript_75315/m.200278 type:complete len:119 (-) Transcript_75315:28-384(-)